MYRRTLIGTAMAALLIAGPVYAGFGAADLIFIPVVSHFEGAFGSNWATDLTITNVDEVAIDVALAYFPSGLVNNGGVYDSRVTWLGGRDSDEFGLINEELADIPPNGTVLLRDIVGEYWVDRLGLNGNGALVIFAYEADTLEPDGTRVYRNAIANARIYNDTTTWEEDPDNPGEFIEVPAEYAQMMPGVPWYNLADAEAVGDTYDFSYEELTGGEETQGLRYNVGVFNASDPLTSITYLVQPFQADGEPFLDDNQEPITSMVTAPPASQLQFYRPFSSEWDLDDVEGATVRVSIANWSSSAAVPVVLMTSYGSMVDNNTNDPSTVLPSFAYPYNVDCMWGGDGGAGVLRSRMQRRPVEIPAQQ